MSVENSGRLGVKWSETKARVENESDREGEGRAGESRRKGSGGKVRREREGGSADGREQGRSRNFQDDRAACVIEVHDNPSPGAQIWKHREDAEVELQLADITGQLWTG